MRTSKYWRIGLLSRGVWGALGGLPLNLENMFPAGPPELQPAPDSRRPSRNVVATLENLQPEIFLILPPSLASLRRSVAVSGHPGSAPPPIPTPAPDPDPQRSEQAPASTAPDQTPIPTPNHCRSPPKPKPVPALDSSPRSRPLVNSTMATLDLESPSCNIKQNIPSKPGPRPVNAQ